MSATSRVLKTKGNKITSRFGLRTITYTSGPSAGQTVTKNHNGIDIVGTGSTLDYIVAHSAGTVQAAGYDATCGYYVQILTASGAVMVYYHMQKGTLKVKAGDKVVQGQVLGYMGATGNVTGAHLHFGIKVNGNWIDPEPYINADYPSKKPTAGSKPTTTKTDYAKSFDRAYAKTYTVTASVLNMRRGAGTNKDIIKGLVKGSKVVCYGYYTKNGATVWLYVQDSTGTVGFCSKKYLQ